MGDQYKLMSLVITDRSNENYAISFDKFTEFIVPVDHGGLNIRHVFDFVFGKSIKNLPIHQTKLIVGNDKDARKEFIRFNDDCDSCFIDQKRYTLKMYTECCEQELRISHYTNYGLLYPDTIKKVLNLNRNNDLKEYLEDISKSVEWKSLHNILRNRIHPLKRQLSDLKNMKKILANAQRNNEDVGKFTENFVRYGLFYSVKVMENIGADNERYEEMCKIVPFDPTERYAEINRLESEIKPMNRLNILTRGRIDYFDGLDKASLDERDEYEDLLANIRYLKDYVLSDSIDSRTVASAHIDRKINLFNAFIEHLTNLPKYESRVPHSHDQRGNIGVEQNRVNGINQKMDKIQRELKLIQHMIAVKQTHKIEIENAKKNIIDLHKGLRNYRSVALQVTAIVALNSILANFRQNEYVYGTLKMLCKPKHPKYATAITLALKKYETILLVDNEIVKKQLKEYLINRNYASCKSIIAVNQYRTISKPPSYWRARNQIYCKLIDCIDIELQGKSAHLKRTITGIIDNIVVCDTIRDAKQISDQYPELNVVCADGVIWNKEFIGICCENTFAIPVKKVIYEAHLGHSKINYELLNEIKNNDLVLKRKTIQLKVNYIQLQNAKTDIEHLLEDQLQFEEHPDSDNSDRIRRNVHQLAGQMLNDFCRENNIRSIAEFELNYERNKAVTEQNITWNAKLNEKKLDDEKIKQVFMKSRLKRNKQNNRHLIYNRDLYEEMNAAEHEKNEELGACCIELIKGEAENRLRTANAINNQIHGHMITSVNPNAHARYNELFTERENKRFFEIMDSILLLEHDLNNNETNGYFDELPAEFKQRPAQTATEINVYLKNDRIEYKKANAGFGVFSLKKRQQLQKLIASNNRNIHTKTEELKNYLNVVAQILKHRKQLFANLFDAASAEIDDIYKKLFDNNYYSAEITATRQDESHLNDIKIAFSAPMRKNFHIFMSEEDLMAAVSLILAIVQHQMWPILVVDLIGVNLKLENAQRIVQYIYKDLLESGKVQQIILFTDSPDVVCGLRNAKKNYMTWSNDFEKIVAIQT